MTDGLIPHAEWRKTEVGQHSDFHCSRCGRAFKSAQGAYEHIEACDYVDDRPEDSLPSGPTCNCKERGSRQVRAMSNDALCVTCGCAIGGTHE